MVGADRLELSKPEGEGFTVQSLGIAALQYTRYNKLVSLVRLELTSLTAYAPQTYVSANSTITT